MGHGREFKIRLLGIDDRHFPEHIRQGKSPRIEAAKFVLSTPSVEDRFSKMIIRSRRVPVPWVLGILLPLFVLAEFVEVVHAESVGWRTVEGDHRRVVVGHAEGQKLGRDHPVLNA